MSLQLNFEDYKLWNIITDKWFLWIAISFIQVFTLISVLFIFMLVLFLFFSTHSIFLFLSMFLIQLLALWISICHIYSRCTELWVEVIFYYRQANFQGTRGTKCSELHKRIMVNTLLGDIWHRFRGQMGKEKLLNPKIHMHCMDRNCYIALLWSAWL